MLVDCIHQQIIMSVDSAYSSHQRLITSVDFISIRIHRQPILRLPLRSPNDAHHQRRTAVHITLACRHPYRRPAANLTSAPLSPEPDGRHCFIGSHDIPPAGGPHRPEGTNFCTFHTYHSTLETGWDLSSCCKPLPAQHPAAACPLLA